MEVCLIGLALLVVNLFQLMAAKHGMAQTCHNSYIFAGIGTQFSQSLRLAFLLKEHAVGKLFKNEITFG